MLCFRAGKAPKQIFVIKCGKDSSGTIAKTWKQPRCPSADRMDKEDVVDTYHGRLLSHKKEGNNPICSNMDATRDYLIK